MTTITTNERQKLKHEEAGKGDKRRPEDTKAYDEGYARIFGEKRPKTPENPSMEAVVKIQQLEKDRMCGTNTT